jgi:hypothetical protein
MLDLAKYGGLGFGRIILFGSEPQGKNLKTPSYGVGRIRRLPRRTGLSAIIENLRRFTVEIFYSASIPCAF